LQLLPGITGVLVSNAIRLRWPSHGHPAADPGEPDGRCRQYASAAELEFGHQRRRLSCLALLDQR